MSLNPTMGILVVDDSPTMRRIIGGGLRKKGLLNIVSADDGDSAWNVLQSDEGCSIDVVICDWKMERMQGIELLERLRSHEELFAVPFIMLTAERNEDKVVQAIETGVTNYLVKPFTMDKLYEKLEQACTYRPAQTAAAV